MNSPSFVEGSSFLAAPSKLASNTAMTVDDEGGGVTRMRGRRRGRKQRDGYICICIYIVARPPCWVRDSSGDGRRQWGKGGDWVIRQRGEWRWVSKRTVIGGTEGGSHNLWTDASFMTRCSLSFSPSILYMYSPFCD